MKKNTTSKNIPIWVLDVPFEWRAYAFASGARWDKNHKLTIYKGNTLPAPLLYFKAKPMSLEWSKQYYLNNNTHLEETKEISPKYKARAHQKTASGKMMTAYKAGSPGFVLADEVGVGKTMSAWDFVLENDKMKTILIVTTSPAKDHWRNTILHAGWRRGSQVMITNYESLGKLFEEPKKGLSSARKKGKRKRLAKQGVAPKYDLVIFDESHKGKNLDSARGIMMRKIQQKAKFCIYASATIGQNPVELIYLYQILAYVTGQKIPSTTIKDFIEWCVSSGLSITRGAFGKVEWEANEKDLKIINDWIFGESGVGIRRLPEDIKGWPAINRQILPIELDFEKRQSYALIWKEFVEKEMMGGKLKTTGKNNISETSKQRLRQQCSWLKIDNTIEQAKELIEQGKKVAISVAFTKTLEEMVEKLEDEGISVSYIHGKINANEKERQRLEFQQGDSQVVIFTVEEAISLHEGEYLENDKPRVLLVHDIRWSAIQLAQIDGRCHRDGKMAPVIWIVAPDTYDMEIGLYMMEKVKSMKGMHGDDVTQIKEIENILLNHAKNNMV